MGKSGPKLTRVERAAAEARVLDLHYRYWSQEAIGLEVDLSQSQVSRILKKVEARYKRDAEARVAAAEEGKQRERERKLDELRHIKRELSDAWERSKREREITETEKSDGGCEGGKGGASRKAKIRREGRDGNAVYATAILACIKEENELLDLYPPTRQEVSGPEGAPIQATATVTFIQVPEKLTQEQWTAMPKPIEPPDESEEDDGDDDE
jgi:hypothetical protein